MATKTILVKLEGKDQLHEPRVRLENISINLFTVDGGTTWENRGITISITGTLDLEMSCKALSGTGWDFKITDKDSRAALYNKTGHTGDTSANYSHITDQVAVQAV